MKINLYINKFDYFKDSLDLNLLSSENSFVKII